MRENKIPTRTDIPDSDKWDLTALFVDVSKWNEGVAWITRTYPKITEWKGRVGESAQSLAEVLEFQKQLDLKIERVYHFASLQLAEDSANNDYLTRFGQLQNLMTKLAEASAFVVPEIQSAVVQARNAGARVRASRVKYAPTIGAALLSWPIHSGTGSV